MSNLSTCPRCSRIVLLPAETDSTALVRCPLCQAEYALSEALASMPPQLIIVPKTESVTLPPEVSAPEISVPLADVSAIETPAIETPSDFTLDFEEHLADSELLPTESEDMSENEAVTVNTDAYSTVAEKPAPENALVKKTFPEMPKPVPRTRPLVKPLPIRRKQKKRGPIRLLLEWLLGGFMALVVVYYGIWWIRGESAGLPRIDWLPGLPAEEPKLPTQPNPQAEKKIAELHPHSATDASNKNSALPQNTAVKSDTPAKSEPQAEPKTGDQPTEGVEVKKIPQPDSSAATPLPSAGPLTPPKFDYLNLDDAIDKATNAFFVEGGGKITAENYSAFCHLAEVQTYSIPSDLTSKQLASAQEFLGTLAKDPKQIAEVAELASKAWKTADATAKETESAQDSDDAKENPKDYLGGILLVGKVTKINTNNGLTGAIIRLADNTNFVVLSLKPMGFKVGDEVLLTGGLIAHPAKNIADFKGKSRLVIWFAAMVPLSTAPEAEK